MKREADGEMKGNVWKKIENKIDLTSLRKSDIAELLLLPLLPPI